MQMKEPNGCLEGRKNIHKKTSNCAAVSRDVKYTLCLQRSVDYFLDFLIN